jgi:cyclopropane-fatty-acyl-phospholipid synthase
MIYTCAYWPEGTQTLEQAQARKIDHVCRKIRLSRGETFIDIGCGFGGFIFRAWETLGALGAGLNITTEQVEWLSSEITRRGFADKFSAREADFRDVDDQYDKVASIGVLEHAGRDQRAVVVHSCDAKQSSGLIILPFATWQRMKCATVQIA